jgi:hypothetical protein
MKAVVVGVFALASALVRDREDAVRDWNARVEESQAFVMPRVAEGDVGEDTTGGGAVDAEEVEVGIVPAPAPSRDVAAQSDEALNDILSSGASSAGQWQIACEIKSGSALVFDRASLRDYGAMTLVRWSAPRTRIAAPGDEIFTAVVNCREKTIEAAWPGRRRETYAGTCGRGLVEAVCAASEQATATPSAHGRPAGVRRAAGTAPRR